ncbi:MAG: enoyl-CoA hydratase/isomerase family protein [Actinobacteria bacterium]|nr:enoyl-CoA hydratase/isomerase family protein [Actinomycetota bacterium]
MGEQVRLEKMGEGVGVVTLDRPPVNALNARMMNELDEILDRVSDDDEMRAVLLWGGAKVFAAGADITEMKDLDSVSMYGYIGRFHEVFARLELLPKVTIAALAGYSLGGGCELALCCDFRIAGARAKLGQPEIALGLIPGAGGTQRLPRLIGAGRAKDLVYSGRLVDAQEALAIGLVTSVVDDADVYEAALAMAARYASGPTVALAAAKRSIQNGLETDLSTGLLLERQAFASLFATEDQKTGMDSFVERGPGKAKFEGR